MRTSRSLFVVAGALAGLAACGPKGTKTTPPPSGKDRIACPDGDALSEAAKTYFAGGNADSADVSASCVAVYTDRPLWVLDGWHESPTQEGVALVTALVDPASKQAVWVSGAGDFSFPPGAIDRMTGPGMSAADLDGDGKDELISITGTSAQGYDVESLSVLVIGATGLTTAGEIPFLEDNSAADPDPSELISCSTEWKLVAGPDGTKQLDLTVTAQTPGESSCLAPGHHVMKWTGHELVEVL